MCPISFYSGVFSLGFFRVRHFFGLIRVPLLCGGLVVPPPPTCFKVVRRPVFFFFPIFLLARRFGLRSGDRLTSVGLRRRRVFVEALVPRRGSGLKGSVFYFPPPPGSQYFLPFFARDFPPGHRPLVALFSGRGTLSRLDPSFSGTIGQLTLFCSLFGPCKSFYPAQPCTPRPGEPHSSVSDLPGSRFFPPFPPSIFLFFFSCVFSW